MYRVLFYFYILSSFTTLTLISNFFSVEPQVVMYPNDSDFFAGSTVRFSCTSYGIPLPSLQWTRNSLNLQTLSTNDTRISIWDETVEIGGHVFARSNLQICGTVETDSGSYSCTASTTERQDSAQFQVNVVGVPPTLIQTPGRLSLCIAS